MLKTALLILTLGDGGALHMALTETDTAEDCAAMAEVVGQMLSGAGYTIAAMRCDRTDLRLTPFEHGRSAAEMDRQYRVTVKGTALEDGFVVQPVASGSCEAAQPDTYCAISAQAPVAQ